ncbi:MAG: TlpA disulfide reductase family protein [Burkholderiaceae bacterium]
MTETTPAAVEPAPAPQAPPSPGRRTWLYGAVAGAAGLAGAGFAWWKFQPHEVADGAEAAFWELSFDTPSGGQLAMKSLKGRPLLLNFWATWCPPCVDELPLLESFFREQGSKGMQVAGLAVDQPSAVRAFLKKIPLTFPNGMAGLGGTDLGKSLGNLGGGLPFTVVFGGDGSVLHRKMGKVTPEDLQAWAKLR